MGACIIPTAPGHPFPWGLLSSDFATAGFGRVLHGPVWESLSKRDTSPDAGVSRGVRVACERHRMGFIKVCGSTRFPNLGGQSHCPSRIIRHDASKDVKAVVKAALVAYFKVVRLYEVE